MTEEKENKENGNVFETWIESYTAISKMWEDSYLKLYKPWLESTSELFEKAASAASGNPEKYKEFYDIWIKTYPKFDRIPTKTNKEILEKLLTSADKSSDIYRSWIAELDENSAKTKDVLNGDPDPAKYKEVYDLWIKSYAKMFDELLTLPFRENIKEIFENYTGIPDIYSDTFIRISRLWNESYTKLYGAWINSVLELSKKSEEISKGNVAPDAYKEFYSLWTNVYQQTYGKLFDVKSIQSKDMFENFAQSTTVCADLYKSWIMTLDKISSKAINLSKETSDQDAYRDMYSLWIKVYQKAFDSFFDNMPTIGPFKECFIPVKNAGKIYTDILLRTLNIWTQPYGRV